MEIRIRLRIFLLVTALAVGGFVVVAPAHLAQAGSTLDSFVGQWAGRGITSNVDAVPRVTARDLDLVIEKQDNGGFTISSTFVQLSQVEQIPRSRTLIFEPSGISDLWQAQEGCTPFQSPGCAWARISANSLVVTVFNLDQDGRAEFQVFDRTVIDSKMKFAFKRVVDGEIKRSVRGNLIKVEDEANYAKIVEAGLIRDVEFARKRDREAATRKAVRAKALEDALAELDAFRAKNSP